MVDIREEEGRAFIQPDRGSRDDLDVLLNQMTAETFHDEVDFGPPAGNEVW
jgi:antitoxin MazE